MHHDRRTSFLRATFICCTLLLGACTLSSPQRSESIPYQTTGESKLPVAAVQLQTQAAKAEAEGDLALAGDLLERALRVAPRNAQLWYALAQLRLAEGAAVQAETLAEYSNMLAPDDQTLQGLNWRLIARSRHSRGDDEGAANANKRADELGAPPVTRPPQ